MINRVVLVGRITNDLDLRRTQSGSSMLSFTIACNRRTKTPGQPDADFIRCVAWNKTAELMTQYVGKGSLIGVEGRIQTGSYDKDGQRVYTTDVAVDSVQFLESKSTRQNNQPYAQQQYAQPQATQPYVQNNEYNNNQFNNGYEQASGYTQDDNTSSYDNDFSSNTLDIASDDLPF